MIWFRILSILIRTGMKADGFDDSVYHFLNIGYVKGYNPGPDFIIQEYFECNPDVKRHGMNPLLHYERYGRKENRIISLKYKN